MRLIRSLVQLILTVALLIGGLTLLNLFDADLNPDYQTFFANPNPTPETENGYFAFHGLDAPQTMDPHTFGKQILYRETPPPADDTLLYFKGNYSELHCWNRQQPYGTRCASEEELRKMISDNQPLLDRVIALYRYHHFETVADVGSVMKGQLAIELQDLLMAKLVLQARDGHSEEALEGWIHNMQFAQRLISGRHSLVGQAIFMVIQSIGISSYPMIANHIPPEILAKHQQALDAIFNAPTFGAGGWDIKATMHKESEMFTFLDEVVKSETGKKELGQEFGLNAAMGAYLPNATRNLFYAYAKDVVALSELPPSEIEHAKQALYGRYQYPWYSLYYNAVGKLILGGMVKGADLLPAAHNATAKRRLLKVYTDAKIAKILNEEMASFIANTPATLHNPLTSKPFEWNPEKNALSFTPPNGQAFEVIY